MTHFEPKADRFTRLIAVCSSCAWALAVARFGLALVRHEHGVDAALAGVLSVALPGMAAAAFLNARIRRSPTHTGNVVQLRRIRVPLHRYSATQVRDGTRRS